MPEVKTPFQVGQLVASNDPGYALRSGCEVYSRAVVVQAQPLVLVSEQADMRWEATVRPERLAVIGIVTDAVLDRCKQRL